MTRDIEINKAAEVYIGKGLYPEISKRDLLEATAFWQGAVWADSHPYWRDMEKEKPQDAQRILAYFGGGVCYPCIYQDDGKDEWLGRFTDGEIKLGDFKVTHWMPIPDLPKAE